jgi:hypothetical protein
MNKSDLYKLIDALPDSKLPVARAYLQGLKDGSGSFSDDFFDSAPYDEEKYTEEELAAIDRGTREAESGLTVSFAQVKAENGLV